MNTSNYKKSPTSEFARACFKELLEDGQPHTFKEISEYVARQAKEQNFSGEFYSGKVWMAVTQLTKNWYSTYARVGYGVYQKGGQRMDSTPKGVQPMDASKTPACDWELVLDKAVELQELLTANFSQKNPLPNMTWEETVNYKAVARNTAKNIDKIIEGVAVMLAQTDDHYHSTSLEQEQNHDQEQEMNMNM